MGATAIALIGFAGWFALLSIVLGVYRVGLVLGGKKVANTFATDGADLAPFGHRLTRARDNCFETLPLFAALALGASIDRPARRHRPARHVGPVRAHRPIGGARRIDQCAGGAAARDSVLRPDPHLRVVGDPPARLTANVAARAPTGPNIPLRSGIR